MRNLKLPVCLSLGLLFPPFLLILLLFISDGLTQNWFKLQNLNSLKRFHEKYTKLHSFVRENGGNREVGSTTTVNQPDGAGLRDTFAQGPIRPVWVWLTVEHYQEVGDFCNNTHIFL